MKHYFAFTLLISFAFNLEARAQNMTTGDEPFSRPKLVVGIVVDQMRYDYLTRFWDRYQEGGFKRLVNEGYLFKNNHFNYVPTATAPGHASVYTGTTPANHGILGNSWYDKYRDAVVYCVEDERFEGVGTKDEAGQMSPHRLLNTTITDELRVAGNYKGKSIALAMKDRGAVLPAGFTGTAYWFHGKDEGKWVSSTYYMESLPGWVEDFNESGTAESYKRTWEPLYELSTYVESNPDDTPYEALFEGKKKAVFPYDLKKLWKKNGGFDMIKATPFGNALTTDFALAAIEGEALGRDAHTDFLAVSYSSTDYVGHRFGVKAVETEDTYLRLDSELKRLLTTLDEKVGKGNYTVFLTADHGAAYVPAYLHDHKIPAGYLEGDEFREAVNVFLSETYGSDALVLSNAYGQIFLDHALIRENGWVVSEVRERLASFAMTLDGVERVFTSDQLARNEYRAGMAHAIQNGFNHKGSGDLFVVFKPAYLSSGYKNGGTSHGTPFIYDTHVPLIFYGKGISHGSSSRKTVIPDIAPTISALLGIPFPNGTTGNILNEVVNP
ncbi:alkaline phosphatase PafA [Robertkochia aurantiaca]|uniref:alkaline phosphatase PafA n=1 Tax=Robertkochia aurantiaca TaxID=2873700 RepID=UPI001CCA6D82|nr:alkaline phosphatase PafA [Robertkochia sp. 3YJGBD-33]